MSIGERSPNATPEGQPYAMGYSRKVRGPSSEKQAIVWSDETSGKKVALETHGTEKQPKRMRREIHRMGRNFMNGEEFHAGIGKKK